jgi:hypothetical protein
MRCAIGIDVSPTNSIATLAGKAPLLYKITASARREPIYIGGYPMASHGKKGWVHG